MDLPESTKVLYNRIKKVEPGNVFKILGYLLIQETGERDMLRLAFCPDTLLDSLITKAKTNLNLSPNAQLSSHPFSSPVYWDPYAANNSDFMYSSSVPNLSLDDRVNSEFNPGYYFTDRVIGPRANRRSPSLPEFPVKVCHYYIKGFCKHGSNCRYFHGHTNADTFNEFQNDENVLSLEKLEMELTELLKMRRGFPVSIASLPMLYYEKYGRTLQAEGYLTESQRHGKAGYSLTKLLARLKNSIRLIDRPHGQHSVILAEDVPKYMEFIGERNDHGGMVSGSRQIYLTFPAESTFSEQDASHYFNKFGPVQDVRIPCQQKRMFGFVTFVFPETVRLILAKGNPHYVCGARVLVKPYRDKSRLVDRKYSEKLQNSTYSGTQFSDLESELPPVARFCNSPSFRKQLMEEQTLEFDRNNVSELQNSSKDTNDQHLFNFSNDEPKHSEDASGTAEETNFPSGTAEETNFPSAEEFSYLLDVLSCGSNSDEKVLNINTNYTDQESNQGGLNLPDSPFAPPIGTGIKSVI